MTISIDPCHVTWCDLRDEGHRFDDEASGVRTHGTSVGSISPASLAEGNPMDRDLSVDLVSVETVSMAADGVRTDLPAPAVWLMLHAQVAELTPAEARAAAQLLLEAAAHAEASAER